MPPLDKAHILIHPHKDKSLLIITLSIVFGHLLFLLWIIFTHTDTKPIINQPTRRLVVQTVALNPERAKSSSTMALEKPIAPKILPPPIEEQIEIEKSLEPEPTVAEITSIEEKEKEVTIPLAEITPVLPLPLEVPLPEIKVDIPRPIEATSPPAPKLIKKIDPTSPPVKVLPKKPEIKKPEIKKKPLEEEKIIKKPTIIKPISANLETPKKETPFVKAPEKKVIAPAAPLQVKPKKVEIDKVTIERQKKIEAEQQAAKARQQKLLSQAQETIAKIDKSRDKVSRTNFSDSAFTSSPSAITNLQIDSLPEQGNKPKLSYQESSYRDELAGRLKLLLKLPEYGEVKIKLSLERSGKVSKVNVISSASAVNRKYIEKTLQTLTFPAFGTNFDQSPQYTFTITLCNDL